MAEIKRATRIQTSFLNAAEKKVLVWLAERQPKWVTSDTLTFVGFIGSVLIFAGFLLTNYSIYWLWLAILGLIINWYGDSLDGTIARVRNTQRPIYGYYLDHTMDVINELLMFVGIGLSPLVHLNIALFAFIFYLILTFNVSVDAHLKQEFKLTYAKLGPTEFRLIIIIICLLYIFVPAISNYSRTHLIIGQYFTLTIFDYIAITITAILAVICLTAFISDLKGYAKIDPPKKFE